MPPDDVLRQLWNISRLSSVAAEVRKHLGVSDKALAEMLTCVALESKLDERVFKEAVRGMLAESGIAPPSAVPEALFSAVVSVLQSFEVSAPSLEAAVQSVNRKLQLRAARTSRAGHSLDPIGSLEDGREREIPQGGFLGSGIDREQLLVQSRQEHLAFTNHAAHGRGAARAPSALTLSAADELRVGTIFRGTVQTLKDFGAFVTFEYRSTRGPLDRRRKEGLVHISQIRAGANMAHPSEVLQRGDLVFVKVLAIQGDRVALSMREVDQSTGTDLNILAAAAEAGEPVHSDEYGNTFRGRSEAASGRSRIVRPDQEHWELTQLANAGVKVGSAQNESAIGAAEGGAINSDISEPEEEVEIEINDTLPVFLAGHGSSAIARQQPLSPVRIVRNPDGFMQLAATVQGALAKERRDMRNQQQNADMTAAASTDELQLRWEDPLALQAASTGSMLAPAVGSQIQEIPEWKRQAMGSAPSFGYKRPENATMREQRESLPIYQLREPLLDAVNDNQLLIVIGETGSGKTTQMTQYLYEAGYSKNGRRIGCTQPRRVAAMSVAARVAEERGCQLGTLVGYSIRFDDCTSPETEIKYMTDGMLLREALIDSDLRQYSVIMLDEAHERTISTDVLFGLLKGCVQRRSPHDFKLIVTSATLDAEKFSQYFFSCPIFTIPGRAFPVEVLYSREPESDYLDAALLTVMQIHLLEGPGDILLFLTGQEEIDTAASILFERCKSLGKNSAKIPPLLILPVYSALPSEMQTRIFEPAPRGTRKCVIATNIAEASLTIDGISYVVDPGFAKQKVYNPRLGMDSLIVAPISQASARQRAGRAGRTGPGKCFRLYTESAFTNELLPTNVPELQRSNLSNVVLMLKALGINDLLRFDFMDPPPTQHLISALETLYYLGALDDEGLLTRLGRKMAEFPLEPMLSKLVLASVDLGCSEEALTIVAMVSVDSVFYRPKEKQAQADQRKARFHQPEGDHITLLAVWDAWKASHMSNAWCHENFIQQRALRRAEEIRKQLVTIMDRYKLDLVSCRKNYVVLRKAIVAGYFLHAAKKDPQEGYRTLVENQIVYVHPASSLFHLQPEWLIYHELIQTTKEYMREAMVIDSSWLRDLAPRFFKLADPNQITRRKRKERIEPLFDHKAQNQNDWRLSRRTKPKK
ncbi:ATP-dependent RNA helicase dhx8 [Porphyridium purpureum]|uniref:RNA helicase n=1 Tax=Porphyridium purpureum TaxID=35688 RepID=A0A5J4Z1J1_PORPP|nr:ATP-dependent RNA helicase dhx8 [Porphyridium purpureum]|eukprot:POR2073..scf208_2